jgi:hypothetical protein
MKKIFVISFVIYILLTLILVGCSKSPVEPASKESPPIPASQESEPAPPVTFDVLFPDGAPPLNHESEIRCIVKSYRDMKNVNIELRLPEGFELTSGNLSWFGDIPGGEKEIIRGTVRAIKTGSWEIDMYRSMDPEWQFGFSIGNGWYDAIYILISEDSAEWRKYPPYKNTGSTPGEVQVERVDETTIPTVDLSISHPPKVNEPAELICTLSSQIDMPGLNMQLELPYGATLIGSSPEWQVDLKAGVPAKNTAQIVFTYTGYNRIGWRVWQTGSEMAWGNQSAIELSIGEDQSSFFILTPVLSPPPQDTP